MDLNNQNSATNTNTDSATPDFGNPVDTSKPSLDMDAINAAVTATDGGNPNMQTPFDVNEISLDDVPQSQEELNDRLRANPEMNLAGGSNIADTTNPAAADLAQNTVGDNLPMSETPTEEKKPTPAATFVDGDIVDDITSSPVSTETAPSYNDINSDPLSNLEANTPELNTAVASNIPADSNVASSTTNATTPTNSASSTEAPTSADTSTPADGTSTHVENTITAPGKKSKLPLILGIIGGVLVIVIVALIIITTSK